MLEIRDPAIKLFGKTIPITGDSEDLRHHSDESSNCYNDHLLEKDIAEDDSMETDVDDYQPDSGDQSPHSESDENQKEPDDIEKGTECPKDENDSNESKNCLQKSSMKKPDKILPCPRCNSMDTKFCYYNNYNVNQPRHFCKSCQRYWTAGGTMRNVPVGAGRRKNKSSASRYYHITMSEALQAAQADVTNGSHPELKTNGMVLTFGSDNHLCEPMGSILNLAEKKCLNPQRSEKRSMNGFTNQVPCFQWPPYMWNTAAVPVPAFHPSGYPPMSFYPAPYWNGSIPWSVPWVTPCFPASQGQKSPGSNLSSPLGKHSRDGEMVKPCDNEKKSGTNTTVLVPKTLRIDDPNEAAKSSIWTTLGINKDKRDPLSKGGFFNSFKSTKGEEKGRKMDNQSWTANPAAFCRSINFQESALR